MPIAVLVPGYGGRLGAVERWRVKVALQTVAAHGGGWLVVSGNNGEADRLAVLAGNDAEVRVEPLARSTIENVDHSLEHLRDAALLAIASDWSHRRRAVEHLRSVAPELADRIVAPTYGFAQGWWMDAAGVAYEVTRRARRRGQS